MESALMDTVELDSLPMTATEGEVPDTQAYLFPRVAEAFLIVYFEADPDWSTVKYRLFHDAVSNLGFDSAEGLPLGQPQLPSDPLGQNLAPVGVLYTNLEEHLRVQLGPTLIAISRGFPYPGWATFRKECLAVLDAFVGIVSEPKILRADLRYINVDDIDFATTTPADWFRYYPALPEFGTVGPVLVRTMHDRGEDEGLVSILTSAPYPETGRTTVALDLTDIVICPGASNIPSIVERLDTMHDAIGVAFEGSITDKYRRRMKEVPHAVERDQSA